MRFVQQEGIKRTLLSRDVPGLIQFFKYGLCGCLALFVHSSIVYTLGLTINPAIGEAIGLGAALQYLNSIGLDKIEKFLFLDSSELFRTT